MAAELGKKKIESSLNRKSFDILRVAPPETSVLL
jgi:hypothetical protein